MVGEWVVNGNGTIDRRNPAPVWNHVYNIMGKISISNWLATFLPWTVSPLIIQDQLHLCDRAGRPRSRRRVKGRRCRLWPGKTVWWLRIAKQKQQNDWKRLRSIQNWQKKSTMSKICPMYFVYFCCFPSLYAISSKCWSSGGYNILGARACAKNHAAHGWNPEAQYL